MRDANDFERAVSAAKTCMLRKRAKCEAKFAEWRTAFRAGDEELADRLDDELDVLGAELTAASKAYYEGVTLL